MNTLSKILATTAVCGLFAGAAVAQTATGTATTGATGAVEAGTDARTQAQRDAEPRADGRLLITGDADPALADDAAVDARTEAQQEAAPAADTQAATTGTAAPGTTTIDTDTDVAVQTIIDAIDRGETVLVVSADGANVGEIETATLGEAGSAELAINLDQDLGAAYERIVYRGSVEIDAGDRVILPLAQAELLDRVAAAQAGG